jgi:hypothetical protein
MKSASPARARFHGPWELFEVLDREFRAIDPTFPSATPPFLRGAWTRTTS